MEVVAAFDINIFANAVYKANFGLTPTTANVEHLTREYYERLGADIWLLSPPCQPFTRGGKLQDDQDARSTGFLYLLGILETMKNPPRYLFLENVLNFEVSRCHGRFIALLRERGYRIEEYLVKPTDPWIGIPNARLRYYLMAVRTGEAAYSGTIHTSFTEVCGPAPATRQLRTLQEYLLPEGDDPKYQVPHRYLTDYKNYRHDITTPSSTRSTTFTKAYGSKHIIGTGSFLQTRLLDLEYRPDDPEALVQIGLRFFTPMEIARLHGLPVREGEGRRVFRFAPDTPPTQMYKLLGNSLNIKVVSFILRRLLGDSPVI